MCRTPSFLGSARYQRVSQANPSSTPTSPFGSRSGSRIQSSRLPSRDPVERVRRLVHQRLGEVRERVEVFKSQIALVPDPLQRLRDGGPVGRAVEEGAEGV